MYIFAKYIGVLCIHVYVNIYTHASIYMRRMPLLLIDPFTDEAVLCIYFAEYSYVYIYIYSYLFIYIYIHICKFSHAHTHTRAHTSTHTHMMRVSLSYFHICVLIIIRFSLTQTQAHTNTHTPYNVDTFFICIYVRRHSGIICSFTQSRTHTLRIIWVPLLYVYTCADIVVSFVSPPPDEDASDAERQVCVYVCVWMCVCVCVCMYMHMYICVRVYISVCLCVCEYVCAHVVRMYVYVFVCICLCVFLCACVDPARTCTHDTLCDYTLHIE